MATFLERLGVELPVVQAGMGEGLAGHELAAAVSAAGGLGTIGFWSSPGALAAEVAAQLVQDRAQAVRDVDGIGNQGTHIR